MQTDVRSCMSQTWGTYTLPLTDQPAHASFPSIKMLAVQTRYRSCHQHENMTPIDLDQWMEDFADFLADISMGSPATGMSEDIYRNLMQYSYRTDGIKRLRNELRALESRARILSNPSGRGIDRDSQSLVMRLQIQLDEEQQSKRQLVAQHARDLEHFQLTSNRGSDEFQRLESKVKQLKAQTKAQDAKITTLENDKADLQNDHALLLITCDRAQADLRKSSNSDVVRVQANYIKDLERVRDTKLQEFEDLDQRMLKERKDYRELLDDRNALQDEKDKLETAYREVMNKQSSLRSRNQELEKTKAVDSKAYRELATEHHNIRNLYRELEIQIKSTRKAHRELSTECKTLRNRNVELEKAQRDFLAEHERVRTRNVELEKSLDERKEAYNVLGSHTDGLQRTVDSLKDRRDRLEQEYEDLAADRETLTKQVRGLESEKKVLEVTTLRLRGLARQIQDASGDDTDPLLSLQLEGGGGQKHPALLPLRLSASDGQLDTTRPYLVTAPMIMGVAKGDKKGATSGVKRGRSRGSKAGTIATLSSNASKASKGSWRR